MSADHPSSDDSFDVLHRSGWSIGDTDVYGGKRLVWLVTGSNGENRIRAEGETRTEA
jgi:hypothetical protein